MNRVIAIDFDGVIASTDEAKTHFAHKELGLTLHESQMKQRYFVDLFGKTQGSELYSKIIDSVYNSERMLVDVTLVENSLKSILKLQQTGWRCVVVTSRKGNIQEKSEAYWAWMFLQKNGFPFEKEDFVNTTNSSKEQVCLSLKAQALVDDDYPKLLPVIESGLRGLLFTTETNKIDEEKFIPFKAVRVFGWKDLLDHYLLCLP